MMHEEGKPRRQQVGNDCCDNSSHNDSTTDHIEADDEDDVGGVKTSISMVSYARNLYNHEGSSVFFKHWKVSALQSAIEKALYFFAFTTFKSLYRAVCKSYREAYLSLPAAAIESQSTRLPTITTLVLGCLAEWAHLPITLPIDAVTTVIQTSKSRRSEDKKQDEDCGGDTAPTSRCKKDDHCAMTILLTILKNKTMYKGIQAYFILCFRPAIQYTIFEQLKSFILKTRQRRPEKNVHTVTNFNSKSLLPEPSLSAAEAFALGMIARAIATLAIFPFQRAKVRMQSNACRGSYPPHDSASQAPEDDRTPGSPCAHTTNTANASIWKILEQTSKEDGIRGLFHGLGPELTRGVLSAALMMMVKERIGGGIKAILYHSRDDQTHKKVIK
jgi:adenine nucleotide transporter 17